MTAPASALEGPMTRWRAAGSHPAVVPVLALGALAGAVVWDRPVIALVAVGAGAGSSLSGSV